MLYKKIHRQFLREFREGRRFKCENFGDIYRIISKPYIDSRGWWTCVKIMFVDKDQHNHQHSHWSVVSITDCFMSHKGELSNKNDITWLED